MKLYRTTGGPIVEVDDQCFSLPGRDWNGLINAVDPAGLIKAALQSAPPKPRSVVLAESRLLSPIGSQEVWAAGVTYFRSRDARMEESKDGGGADFYAKVYEADRPELFFKATPHRVVGPGQKVRIRKDSAWNVPEPELTLVVNSGGKIVGYTVGNDMSSRDIEGANPLYLPQAKVYDGCCALGPCILLKSGALPTNSAIKLQVLRNGNEVFAGSTTLDRMKRSHQELVTWLMRDNSFPNGVFLLTGTGIIPPNEFTLADGDQVRIEIDGIGVLSNTVSAGQVG